MDKFEKEEIKKKRPYAKKQLVSAVNYIKVCDN